MVTDMGESNKHKVLVEYALRFIKDSVGEELSYFIETDINDGRPLPQLTMEGYRPDVFFEYNGVMFIGEARSSFSFVKNKVNKVFFESLEDLTVSISTKDSKPKEQKSEYVLLTKADRSVICVL